MIKVEKMCIVLTQQTLTVMRALDLKLMQRIKLRGILLG